jgi:REP element-mobilizing transposase RayT
VFGAIAVQEWKNLEARFPNLQLEAFVVMPNHVHGILLLEDLGTAAPLKHIGLDSSRRAPTRGSTHGRGTALPDNDPLDDLTSRALDSINKEQFGKPVPGSIPTIIRSYKSAVTFRIHRLRNSPDHPIWQRNYYERVIRNEREFAAMYHYIESNPLNWEKDPDRPCRHS